MRRRGVAAVLTGLGLTLGAGSAQAQWGEAPFRALAPADPAVCLRSAGQMLTLLDPAPRGRAAIDLFQAGAGGAQPVGRVPAAALTSCPALAADPSGGAVIAYAEGGARSGVVRAATRAPGAALSRPVTVGGGLATAPTAVTAAISPRGDVLLAWSELPEGFPSSSDLVRLRVSRRPPGGEFGEPETVASWRSTGLILLSPGLVAGADASGGFTLAWSQDHAAPVSAVFTAGARPGARFTVDRVGEGSPGGTPDLAVAADGAALLAYGSNNGIRLFDRPAGAGRFTAAGVFGAAVDLASDPALAIGPRGAAVLAWRVEDGRPGPPTVRTALRPPGGTFPRPPAPVSISPDDFGVAEPELQFLSERSAALPIDGDGGDLRTQISSTGRVLLTLTAPRPVRPGSDRPHAPYVLAGTLTGGVGAPVALGVPTRAAEAAAPIVLPRDELGVAWTDNVTSPSTGSESPLSTGRLHVATEGPATASPASPRVRLTVATRRQRIYPAQALVLEAACDRPCDLRGFVAGGVSIRALGTAQLRRAGETTLRLLPTGRAIAPRRPGQTRVIVRASAPGATAFTSAVARVPTVRRAAPPLPLALDLRARRVGDEIRVSWQTRIPARRVGFEVVGNTRRVGDDPVRDERRLVAGRGRTRFRVRLRPRRPGSVRFVSVISVSEDPRAYRRAAVRVEP